MPIQTIDKQNVSEKVFKQLEELIISGEWKPGDRIPSEVNLAKIMNVSRVTIRSALQKLENLHIVSRQQGSGTVICDLAGSQQINSLMPMLILSPPEITYMNEFRMLLECGTIEIAAARCSPENLQKLRDNLSLMAAYINEGKDSAEVDVDFHCLIAEATENPLIVKTFYAMRSSFLNCMREYKKSMDIHTGLHFHEKLIEAIANHDPYNARKLMEEQLKRNQA